MQKNYTIGIDIGTESVGWAVVEENTQKIIKKGGKALWGVRLFESAETAADRRQKRSARRRYERRRQRIKLLQQEFLNEINKVDPSFFQKLEESKYLEDDLNNKKLPLTTEEKNQIKQYHEKYKTIYHLRNRLINDDSKEDIRLVYLAIHHIIKYRGNFLYGNSTFNVKNINIKERLIEVFDSLSSLVPTAEIPYEYQEILDLDKIEKILLLPSKKDIQVSIKEHLKGLVSNNFLIEFPKMIIGNQFNINKMIGIEDSNETKINFTSSDYDDKYVEYENLLGDKIEVLDAMKNLYDSLFLKKLFQGSNSTSLSGLMVEKYKNHESDLKFLKKIFKNNRTLYNKLFRTKEVEKPCLYDKYIHNSISYDDFTKELNKLFEKLFSDNNKLIEQNLKDKYLLEVQGKIENKDFLPRITSTDNGKFPYQLNKDELIEIIRKQGKYYKFLLNEVDNDYKIVKLLEFKIPYYVGPLVSKEKSENAWMVRKKEGVRITPYNFDEVIDKEKTATCFIERMISHCTYLLDELALPNNSILYSKYKVMNELKQIRINGAKVTNDIQHKIFNEFFLKTKGTLTERKFINYLLSSKELDMYNGELKITGYSADKKFANTMQSYLDFFGENGIFLTTDYTEVDAENIIRWVTIFEDKDILKEKIEKEYSNLSEDKVNKIIKLKYSGWGNLSKELLTTKYYKDKHTELPKSILDLMYETDKNFMQIINDDEYKFQDMIKEHNQTNKTEKLNYDVVKNLATSPATKRGIYQALKVVDEIVKYMGYDPKNISIEFARNDDEKKRKDTRKDYLKKLYDNCKNDIENYKKLRGELDSHEINSQRLFLYFIQEGKCLYSGKPINIEDINNNALYEVDHIIPRTLIKDDSIDNKALVSRECNQDKKNNYILPEIYRKEANIKWWKRLKDCNLMSAKKFHNLVRNKYSDEDIKGFINRQLVETRQITKHVANILSNYYKKTRIIYLKADLSHSYREKYDLFKFREINDYHHAHDAYLAAVLGEYKENYMKWDINFDQVKELNKRILELSDNNRDKLRYGFVINSLDENVVDIVSKISKNYVDNETGEILFDAHAFNNRVENTLYRNDILISKKTEIKTGKLYKETIYKKGKGKIKIKENMPIEKYGGYSNMETKYLMLIDYKNKRKLLGIPMPLAIKNDLKLIDIYIREQLKLKENEVYSIKKEMIPYETEVLFKGQKVYLKGYSISNNCAISNAQQLKISVADYKKWKYALEYILHENKKYLDYALIYIDAIYNFLINRTDYPLYNNCLSKIKEVINFNTLSLELKVKVIKEMFKLFQCNSVNANLSDFKLGDRIGRLSSNITEGTIISKSTTGIKENKYEF